MQGMTVTKVEPPRTAFRSTSVYRAPLQAGVQPERQRYTIPVAAMHIEQPPTAASSRPRRAIIDDDDDDNPGYDPTEPFKPPVPVGDVPAAFLVLGVLLYVLWKKKKTPKRLVN